MTEADRRKIAEINSGMEYVKDKIPEKQYVELEVENNKKIEKIKNGTY